MTPTLMGRWQTRLLLLTGVGAPLTLVFGLLIGDLRTPFLSLGYVILFGLGWDALQQALQVRRWDRDWPPAFFAAFGILEGVFLWLVHGLLPGYPPDVQAGVFFAHYGLVFLTTFLIMLGPIRLLFPRWRFNGAEII